MRWWAESSKGDVHIVILLVVDKANKKIQILKYIPGTSPTVQGLMTDITIDYSVSPPRFQGGPLILEFVRVFSRLPTSAAEPDIVVSEQKLVEWSGTLFS